MQNLKWVFSFLKVFPYIFQASKTYLTKELSLENINK